MSSGGTLQSVISNGRGSVATGHRRPVDKFLRSVGLEPTRRLGIDHNAAIANSSECVARHPGTTLEVVVVFRSTRSQVHTDVAAHVRGPEHFGYLRATPLPEESFLWTKSRILPQP